MARKCASKMLLDVLDEARMRTLAPDVRMLWLDIARMMQRDGISVLRFGKQVLNTHGLSRLISRPETENETELETKITELCERGLLARDDDGALVCPMLQAAITRSEINKVNGSKGGRPRKDGSPPAQRSLMLPIDGAGGKTKITETETGPKTNDAETSTYLLKESVKGEVSSDEIEFHETGRAALEAAGFDPARSMATYGIVRGWLAAGADRALILDVIERRSKPGITTLKYFDAAVREAIAAKPPAVERWRIEWRRAYEDWEFDGRGFRPCPEVQEFKERFAA